MFGELILNDPFHGPSRVADSGFVNMGDIEARLYLNLPLRLNQNPINFTVEIKAKGNTGQYNTIQKVYLVENSSKTEIYNKKGDISLDKNGNGKRSLSTSNLIKKISKKQQVVFNFEVIPSQKTASSTVGQQKAENAVKVVPLERPAAKPVYIYTPPPTPVNTREAVGFIGLINQGSTCYMNSSLQSLFTNPAIRNLIYNIPITSKTPIEQENDPVLNLQILFYKLQYENEALSTNLLTKSFGWNDEVYIQHDAAEFLNVLLNTVSQKIKSIPQLLQNFNVLLTTIYYNMAAPVNTEDWSMLGKKEDTRMLNVPIINSSNVQNAIKRLGNPSDIDDQITINGVRTYAKMKTIIEKLPVVLTIQLLRLSYAKGLDGSFNRIKLTDRVEYTNSLIVESTYDGEVKYNLHAVICHTGSATGGHYYSFIKPTSEEKWLWFNDTSVSVASNADVYDKNFDGGAYILMYVMADEEERLFKDPALPSNQITEFFNTSTNMTEITVTTDSGVIENTKEGKTGIRYPSKETKISISRMKTIEDVCIQAGINYPHTIFSMDGFQRPNSILDPTKPIAESLGNDKTIFVCHDNISSRGIIFLKTFDPSSLKLTFVGIIPINEESTILSATESVTHGLQEGFEFFVEGIDSAEKIDPITKIFGNNNDLVGSIIVIQPKTGAKLTIEDSIINYLSINDAQNAGLYSTFLEMKKFIKVDLFGIENTKEPIISVRMPSNLPISEFKNITSSLTGISSVDCQLFRLRSGTSFMRHVSEGNIALNPAGDSFVVVEYRRQSEDEKIIVCEVNDSPQNRRFLVSSLPNWTLQDSLRGTLELQPFFNAFSVDDSPSMNKIEFDKNLTQETNYIFIDVNNHESQNYVNVVVESKHIGEPLFFTIDIDNETNFEQIKNSVKTKLNVDNSTFNRMRVSFGNIGSTIAINTTKIVPLKEANPNLFVRVLPSSSVTSTERSIIFYN